MVKAFSVASWNIEHFGGRLSRRNTDQISGFIAQHDADVIALYEVESSEIFWPLVNALPGYQYFITEGEQAQEILVGVKKGMTSFVTQKLEFKSGQSTLRPGMLVTLLIDQTFFPILFLHLKSMRDPKGFGLRHDMLRRAYQFREVLDAAARHNSPPPETGAPPPRANYLFAGDFNTMGLDYYPRTVHDISSADEIAELHRFAKYKDMRVLSKNAPATFWNGSGSSIPAADLDHVVAADHLQFKDFNGSEVDVRGWPQEIGVAKQDEWITQYSDHALLYFEVQMP